ncbi:hypothetical protein [Algibacter lectus]|uniref:Uncharacterized protein n=1 Tax=Algibacter lectus TaxID=221126 RepID=A0A4R8M8W0_9FLAO|nr:hypothetical protein [Algibacter lectus]MWW24033.1 hypothetical protein [Algibacter lectus]TDY62049.1 hypothetical protein DFQ06_1863 [Algibacter lectus]
MDNGQILETAKEKTAKGIDLNDKESLLYNNYLNVLKMYPKTYTNDAYGQLSELYDCCIKDIDVSQISDNEFRSLVIDIDNTINEIIDYVKKYDLKAEKFNSIVGMVKIATKVKHKIRIIPKEDYNELIEEGFDFDLDAHKNNKLMRSDGGFYYESLIRDAIKEIKAAEPGEVVNKKGPGNKTAERLPADQLIIKNWHPNTKIRFIDCLKDEFSKDEYKPKDINNVISYLTVNGYIDTSKDNIVIKEAFCIALKNKKEFQSQTNFDNYYMKTNKGYENKFPLGKKNAIPEKINNIIITNNIG